MKNVYSPGKIFHFPDKLADLRAGRVTPPIHVRLKPTNRCNHRCGYCCYRSGKLFLSEKMDERDEIPPAKMAELIEDFAAMGVKAVTFTGGGEPLCCRHILQAFGGLFEAGIKVALLTNGSLLAGEAAELLAARAVWVRASMDAADRDAYARARGVKPAEFDTVCDNLRRFAATPGRRCVLGVNLIVTAENSPGVFSFLRMARDLGVDHVKVSCAVVATDPAENAAYMAPFYEDVKAQVARGASELAGPAFGVIDKFHLPDSDAEGFRRNYTWCPFAQCLTVVAADQNVYTCQDKAYTSAGLLGSIRDRRFRDFWASPELRDRLAALDPSRHCRHHCVAHGKNLSLLEFFDADDDHLDFV